MFDLTTPKSILLGFFMVAVSVASLPYSRSIIIRDAQALDSHDLNGIESALNSIADAIKCVSIGEKAAMQKYKCYSI